MLSEARLKNPNFRLGDVMAAEVILELRRPIFLVILKEREDP
jgi:hypothetical protein